MDQPTLFNFELLERNAGPAAAVEKLRARLLAILPSEWWVDEFWDELLRRATGGAVRIETTRGFRRGVESIITQRFAPMPLCGSCRRLTAAYYLTSSGDCFDCLLASVEELESLEMQSAGMSPLAHTPGRVGSTFHAGRTIKGAFADAIVGPAETNR